MSKYRKKPVVIEARQFDGSEEGLWLARNFLGGSDDGQLPGGGEWHANEQDEGGWRLYIATLEGVMEVSPGDWIIQGVQGEFYPCKPDIFAATYEPADD